MFIPGFFLSDRKVDSKSEVSLIWLIRVEVGLNVQELNINRL